MLGFLLTVTQTFWGFLTSASRVPKASDLHRCDCNIRKEKKSTSWWNRNNKPLAAPPCSFKLCEKGINITPVWAHMGKCLKVKLQTGFIYRFVATSEMNNINHINQTTSDPLCSFLISPNQENTDRRCTNISQLRRNRVTTQS